jgi:hypothetical protein
MTSETTARSRRQDDRAVLADVKAKPSRRPTAGLDTGCGRHARHLSGAGEKEHQLTKIQLTEVSAVWGDSHGGAQGSQWRAGVDAPLPRGWSHERCVAGALAQKLLDTAGSIHDNGG